MKKTILAATITSIFLVGCGSDIKNDLVAENLAPVITLEQLDYEIVENSSIEINIDVYDEIDENSDIEINVVSSLAEVTASFSENVLTITTGEVIEDLSGIVTLTATDSSGLSASVTLNIDVLEGAVVVTEGVITGFGSVFIDGVEYETDETDFEVNDENSDESSLEVGMVIKLKGLSKSNGVGGVASSIVFSDTVRGVIEVVNLEENTFNVMGQVISFNDETNFKNLLPEELINGNVVVVSGSFDDEGTLVASFVAKKADSKEQDVDKVYRLKGEISELNTDTMTFRVGDMTIDYSNAEIDIEEGAVGLSNGSLVKVKGTNFESVNSIDDLLVAEKVDVESKSLDSVVKNFVVEGFITDVDYERSTFIIKNHEVSFSNIDTKFLLGNSKTLSKGLRVGVKIVRQDENVAFAESIIFFHKPNISLEGEILDINLEEKLFSVAGVDFKATNRTKFEDDSDLDVKYFNLDDLTIGDYVDVKGIKFYLPDLNNESIEFLGLDKESENEYVIFTTSIERDNQDSVTGTLEFKGLISINDKDEVVMLDKVVSFDGKSVIKHDELEVTQEEMVNILKEFKISDTYVNAEIHGYFDGEVIYALNMDFKIKHYEEKGVLTFSEIGNLILNDSYLKFPDKSLIFLGGEQINFEDLIFYIENNQNADINASVTGYKSGDSFIVSKLKILKTENIILNGTVKISESKKIVFNEKELIFNENSKIVSGDIILSFKEFYNIIDKNKDLLKANIKGDLVGNKVIVKEIYILLDSEKYIKKEGVFYINQNNEIMINKTKVKVNKESKFFINGEEFSESEFKEFLLMDAPELSGFVEFKEFENSMVAINVFGNFETAYLKEKDGILSKSKDGNIFLDNVNVQFYEYIDVFFGEKESNIYELLSFLNEKNNIEVTVEYEEKEEKIIIYLIKVKI